MGISSRAYSYFIFHVLLLQPSLIHCVQFYLALFIFCCVSSPSHAYFRSFRIAPPLSAHLSLIRLMFCMESRHMAQPGRRKHKNLILPVLSLFIHAKDQTPSAMIKRNAFSLSFPLVFSLHCHSGLTLIIICSRRCMYYRYATSPAEHFSEPAHI